MSSGDDRQQLFQGVALASAASQVGCVIAIVAIGSMVVGLGLDKVFDTRPLFTLLLVLGSIPASLYLAVRIALSAAARLNPPPAEEPVERTEVSQEAPPGGVPSKEE